MRKSELLAALEKIHGDPEIEVRVIMTSKLIAGETAAIIDRINEYPRPEIVVIEK